MRSLERLSVGLVHHPVRNKRGEVVASSITSLDLHDIARAVRTFGADRFYVIHPGGAQRAFAARLIRHWTEGAGAAYNPCRAESLGEITLVADIPAAVADIRARHGATEVELVATGAALADPTDDAAALSGRFERPGCRWLLLLGTGWGLAPELLERCPVRLEPIRGSDGYNHLSVRAAAAIILDRLSRPQ